MKQIIERRVNRLIKSPAMYFYVRSRAREPVLSITSRAERIFYQSVNANQAYTEISNFRAKTGRSVYGHGRVSVFSVSFQTSPTCSKATYRAVSSGPVGVRDGSARSSAFVRPVEMKHVIGPRVR